MKKNLILIALLAFTVGARAEDNSAKLALAREAISAMQADKMFDAMADQMKQMAKQFGQVSENNSPELQKLADGLQDKIMDLSMSEAKGMLAKMDTIYASVYTDAELKAMVAFFKSPEGASMMAKQPQVMAQMMPLMQEMQQSLSPKMQKIIEEFQGQVEALKAAAKPAGTIAPIPAGVIPPQG